MTRTPVDGKDEQVYLLHENHACRRQRRLSRLILTVALIAIVFLAVSLLCSLIMSIMCEPGTCNMTSDCRVNIVESIPENLTYPAGSPSHLSTFDSWMQLIKDANKSIDIVAFYWSLLGSDIEYDSPTAKQGELILESLLHAVKERHIKLRVVNSYKEVTDNDTLQLIAAGAEVRSVNFRRLFNAGVLHTKMWLVDGAHLYVGSANMDWRSLTQVKELGAVITNCPCLVADAAKLFDVYWYLGQPDTPIPNPWPSRFDTTFNAQSPMKVYLNNTSSLVYLSSSPPQLCPHGRTSDIDAILNVIENAKEFIDIAVMDYVPAMLYVKPSRFWSVIDDALRKAALDRGVRVRLLASKWNHTKVDMYNFLRSLTDLNGAMKAKIEVKLFVVPAFSAEQAKIPFARVNHNKYMVTDNIAFIGTSNWSGDYFVNTGGVGLVVNQTDGANSLQQQLVDVFERDWNSVYAQPL